MKSFTVYILSSRSRNLYVGVTSDIRSRIAQHKDKTFDYFTSSYNISLLVYFEAYPDAQSAISREKQLKGWSRTKNIALIEAANPTWDDLSEG